MSTGIYLSAAQAAKLAGVNKTTIVRAISAGRLSASKNDKGGYDIDPAELCRVFPPASEATGSAPDAMHQHATGSATDETMDLKIAVARLQAERDAQQALIDELRDRMAEASRQRDKWQEQAQTLALTDQSRRQAASAGWFARTFGGKKSVA